MFQNIAVSFIFIVLSLLITVHTNSVVAWADNNGNSRRQLESLRTCTTERNGDINGPIIMGTPSFDVCIGTDHSETIILLAGADTAYGNGGDDIIMGNLDDDKIFGNGGEDLLQGDFGDDIIHGGGRNDILIGGEGDDILSGEDGNDKLYGDIGNDILKGGLGALLHFHL